MNLVKAQQGMKNLADRKRGEEEFHKGDMVYLKLNPYLQKSLAKRPFDKSAPRFYGPFQCFNGLGRWLKNYGCLMIAIYIWCSTSQRNR